MAPTVVRAGAGKIHREAADSIRILFLGGTNFVGPAIVDVALERGHEVTLFNRGVTNPWLYTYLERLVGNRYPERGAGLDALRGDRRWDAVIDTWQGSPLAVERTAELLRDRVDAYVYISSIAVYQGVNYCKASFDESAPLPVAEMPDSFDVELPYPVRKQLGEAAVTEALPDRHGILRAYSIIGTDARGELAGVPYWPIRLYRGGDVLAPGDGEDATQWTDVRDLAEFTVHAIETDLCGTYNVSRGRTPFREFLEGLARLSPEPVRLHWVPAEFLLDQGLRSFTDVPLWVWRGEVEKGFFYASAERARNAGLHPRSVAQTFGPVLDAYLLHRGANRTAPLPDAVIARREEEILTAWRVHREGS
ncbi:MAG: NAD-dependent epimerase/dehydratase family protein [Gemmatimonadota bacterium]|nr:NAD-dependent epimerase/dehydratase family protein [Gemmatimonadota bacterium]